MELQIVFLLLLRIYECNKLWTFILDAFRDASLNDQNIRNELLATGYRDANRLTTVCTLNPCLWNIMLWSLTTVIFNFTIVLSIMGAYLLCRRPLFRTHLEPWLGARSLSTQQQMGTRWNQWGDKGGEERKWPPYLTMPMTQEVSSLTSISHTYR